MLVFCWEGDSIKDESKGLWGGEIGWNPGYLEKGI